MSDTPRTDAACNIYDLQIVAEDIERELNAANSEIERLTNKVAQLYEGAEELKQRIKRLEEVGDALEYASVVLEAGEDSNGFEKLLIAQREWHKAKEDKP